MNGEQLGNNSEATGDSDANVWQEAMKDVPPFGGAEQQEQEESGREQISERAIAEEILRDGYERQEEIDNLLNNIDRSSQGFGFDFNVLAADYQKKHSYGELDTSQTSLDEYGQELTEENDFLQLRETLVADGIRELESRENAGKSLAEIFAAQATKMQTALESLNAEKNMPQKLLDMRRKEFTDKMQGFRILAEYVPIVQDRLLHETFSAENEAEDVSEVSESEPSSDDWQTRYDREIAQERELKKQKEQERYEAETEHLLGQDLNLDAILQMGDEDVEKSQQAVDRLMQMGWPIGSEEMAKAKVDAAKRTYEAASERWRAEKTVLLEIEQDYNETTCSREDLEMRLKEYQSDIRRPDSEHRKEHLALDSACRRILQRLSNIETSWEGEKKLSEDDQSWLERATKKGVTYNAGEVATIETDTADDEMQMEDVDTGKRFENSRVPMDEDFKRRIQEFQEQQERIDEARRAATEAARQNHTEQEAEVIQQPQEGEKAPASYESGQTVIVVGQEIPASWFQAAAVGDKSDSGFGISIKQTPPIENFLQQALNVEFSKLSADEREQHDYAAIARALKDEANRTRKMPDIIATIKAHRKELEDEEEMGM